MTFLVLVLFILLFLAWFLIRARFNDLEQRIEQLTVDSVSVHDLAALRTRVGDLESRGVPKVEPEKEPVPQPRVQPEPTAVVPPPLPTWIRPPVATQSPDLATVETARPSVAKAGAALIPQPSLRDRLRRLLGDEEWETLLGGSLLNKLGALILVIGIALFLGYSFAHLQAAGRALISLIVSGAMLGAGIWTERRARFQVFARGLIGAGWAALYATSYAIYAVPEARIITNPYVGSLGMLLVAAGMIGHSLRYRVQAITAVAYFAAFAAVAVSPTNPFALISLIPLAASLLYLAARFQWNSMALFGLCSTYLTCIGKAESYGSLRATESILLVEWCLFEAFDLLRIRRSAVTGGVEFLFPLNSIAFLGLSYLAWSRRAPNLLWLGAAIASALFLGSAIARALTRPPSSFPKEDSLAERLRAGSFEGAFLISALLAGMAIVGRIPGVWISFGLAIEAEIIYLAGLRFRSDFLRRMGGRAFAFSLARLSIDGYPGFQAPVFGHPIWNWTPGAIFHVALFYANWTLRKPGVLFSSGAAALVAFVIAAEVPVAWMGVAWFVFGLALFETGLWRRAYDLRVQAYLLLAGGAIETLIFQVDDTAVAWQPMAVVVTVAYLFALRGLWINGEAIDSRERQPLSLGLAAIVAAMGALLLWRVIPTEYLGLAWTGWTLLLFELGDRRWPAELRLTLLPMSVLSAIATAIYSGHEVGKDPASTVALSFLGASLAAWTAAARLTIRPVAESAPWERTGLRDFVAGLGTVAAACWIWNVVPDPWVSAGWCVLGVGLLQAGSMLAVVSLRWSAVGIMGLAFARGMTVDSQIQSQFASIADRLISLPLLSALLGWAAYRLSRSETKWERFAGRIFMWAAAILMPLLVAMQATWPWVALGWVILAVAWRARGPGFELRISVFRG